MGEFVGEFVPPGAQEQQGTHSLFQGETSGATAESQGLRCVLALQLSVGLLGCLPAGSRTSGRDLKGAAVLACACRAGLTDAPPQREHFGETAAGGPADRLPGTASAQVAGAAAAAASHHAGHHQYGEVAGQQGHAKRKMSEMGEVGGPLSPSAAAATGGMRAEEVQECDMQQAAAAHWQQQLSADSGGEGEGGAAGFNR